MSKTEGKPAITAKNLTYRLVELDQPVDLDFDLECWLADLLVDYWQSQERGNDVG